MSPGVLQKVKDATVMVCVEYGDGPDSEVSWGSGMIVGDGLVVTNAHVVNEKAPMRIWVANHALPRTPASVLALRYDSNEFTIGGVAAYVANTLSANIGLEELEIPGKQKNNDMAVLSFTPPAGRRLPALSFALSTAPGERIVAAGYPGGGSGQFIPGGGGSFDPLGFTPQALTAGSVTGITDSEPLIIVHDAQCSTGNSGGPVVNTRGEVVGMQTWTTIPGSGDGYMSMAVGGANIVAFLEANGVRPSAVGRGARPHAPEGGQDLRPFVLNQARAGNPDYQALAGLLHFLGIRGFPRDDNAAVNYLHLALQTGAHNPNAYLYQAGLAAVLIQSPAFWRPELAESLIRSANTAAMAVGGTHPDHRLLAFESALRMQGKASGLREDPDRSLQLAEKALEGGFALPFALSGYHYYFGDTAAGKDHARALRNAREAARNGIPEGISLLAHLYYDSDVVARNGRNLQVARALAEEAAAMGDPWAYGLLANMYYDSGNAEEKAKARDLALQGMRFGNRLALYCVGRMAWDQYQANPGDLAKAVRAWACIELAER